MNSRRKFFFEAGQKTLKLVAGASVVESLSTGYFQPNIKSHKPIILSTWNNVSANEAALKAMQSGATKLDALETGIKIPEADVMDSSVGYGGLPDDSGEVSLDACIMDHRGNAGSVCYLKGIKHPISVARKVMEDTPHVILAGDGAQDFALTHGYTKTNLLSDHAREQYEKYSQDQKKQPVDINNHDTIGMLVMDQSSQLCGGCSTSGLAFKKKGRVGDSPIIGAGLYVDNEVGAATATGLGELVLKTLGTFLIVEFMRMGIPPKLACKKAIERIVQKYDYRDHQVGYIAINKHGRIGAYSIRPGFNFTQTINGETAVLKADSYIN